MATHLQRLGLWCARHAGRVVAAWLVLFLALGALAATVSRPLTNQVTIPGSDHAAVWARLRIG